MSVNENRYMTFYVVTPAKCEEQERNSDFRRRPLSPHGRASAEGVARLLSGVHIDAVYVSPEWRALDTLSPVAITRGIGIEIIHELCAQRHEKESLSDCDNLCAMPFDEVIKRLSENGDMREAAKRCAGLLRAISKKLRDKTVLIGTHETVLLLLLCELDPAFRLEMLKQRQNEPYIYKFVLCGEEYVGSEQLILETETPNGYTRY